MSTMSNEAQGRMLNVNLYVISNSIYRLNNFLEEDDLPHKRRKSEVLFTSSSDDRGGCKVSALIHLPHQPKRETKCCAIFSDIVHAGIERGILISFIFISSRSSTRKNLFD